jgi:hypothetical protein
LGLSDTDDDHTIVVAKARIEVQRGLDHTSIWTAHDSAKDVTIVNTDVFGAILESHGV